MDHIQFRIFDEEMDVGIFNFQFILKKYFFSNLKKDFDIYDCQEATLPTTWLYWNFNVGKKIFGFQLECFENVF